MHTVGVIYGNASSTRFDVAVSDTALRRLDYVVAELDGVPVLGQVEQIVRKSDLSLDDALAGPAHEEDRLSASVQVVGFRDGQGRVQVPRAPFRAGLAVHRAGDALVTDVLGLEPHSDGAYVGRVKGTDIPVRLSMNALAQKHVSVLAKTGAGKSYTVGVLLEEFLAAGVPLVILDPHGEYGSLRHANVDATDIAAMAGYGTKPRSFDKMVREYSPDTRLNPDAQHLMLEGMNLEGREIVDLLGSKITGGQVGVLHQAVREVKENLPAYTLQDIMDAVGRNKSNARWNVLNALEALEATQVFQVRGTPVRELVRPRQCTIINLKGIPPDVQDVVVTRFTHMLWEARKRGEIPAHILVVEEAHNFCPERGVGNAVSGPVLRTVASEGRKFGMGLVIVSQRPAKIDKNVLSQCNTQFVLKVTNPNDLKAVIAGVEGITSAAADELQRLPVGSALVTGGGLTQPVLADIRPRMTRHGGQSVRVVPDPPPTSSPPTSSPPTSSPPTSSPPTSSPRPDTTPRRGANSRDNSMERESDRVRAKPSRGQGPGRSLGPEKALSEVALPGQHAPAQRGKKRGAPPDPAMGGQAAYAPSWSPADIPGIQRVAARVGLAPPGADAEETLRRLKRSARREGQDPDRRLILYAEVARRACRSGTPVCIRCPLRDRCECHARLEAERKKTRAGVRRLWSP